MQLEEIREQWRRLDRKLDRSLALESELVRRVVMQPARRRLNRLAIWPALDVVLSVGGLALSVASLTDHWRDLSLALPASVIVIGALALLIDSIRQLERLTTLDWSGPVAEIQGSLEWLRVTRIRQFKWVILLGPLVGFCGLTVGLHRLFGWLTDGRVNILDKFDPWWVAGNYVFGVLFVPLGWFTARFLAEKCHKQRWWQSVLDDISGNSLKSATDDVERWANLQRETSEPGD